MRNQYLYGFILSLLFLISACGSSDDETKPPPAPLPVITSFTASSLNILAGDAVKLTAVFSNGQGTIDVGVGSINSGESKVVLPNNTTTYTLTVENVDGIKVTSAVTIETVPLLINITYPTDNLSVHDQLQVRVVINSQLDITKVVANVGAQSSILPLYDRHNNIYIGHVSLTGMSDGEHILTVTATDEIERTNFTQQTITINNLPVITITEPNNHGFATPLLPLDISCEDKTNDCLITVKNQDTILASAINHINEVIDLSDSIGEKVTLMIEGKVIEEPVVLETRDVYVNNSNVNLTLVKAFTSDIVDFDGSRALLYGDVDTLGKQVQIANISNEEVIVLETPTEHPLNLAGSFLTPTGAIYQIKWRDTFDWNNSQLFNLGETSNVRLAGDYALFSEGNNLKQRQLSTQTDTTINLSLGRSDVSANGTIIGENNWSLLQYKDGETTRINLDPGTLRTSKEPLIDGSLILYQETGDSGNVTRIVLHDGNEMVFAVSPSYHFGVGNIFTIKREEDYDINNGWVAYLDGTGSSANQLWTRDSNGNILQRTDFAPIDLSNTQYANTIIEMLAENGELMLLHNGKRYLSKTNGQLILIGSSELGKSFFINNIWYVAIEKNLYKLELQ